MQKKIEVEIDATCENCFHFENKSSLPSDGYVCVLDGSVVESTDYCQCWVLHRAIFNDSPRSFMVLEKEED